MVVPVYQKALEKAACKYQLYYKPQTAENNTFQKTTPSIEL